jgi:hypothetical protein
LLSAPLGADNASQYRARSIEKSPPCSGEHLRSSIAEMMMMMMMMTMMIPNGDLLDRTPRALA